MYIQYMFIKITTHIYTYIYFFLSTPVENPANSSNPVKSGLVFEMVKSGPVPAKFSPIRFRSGHNFWSGRTLLLYIPTEGNAPLGTLSKSPEDFFLHYSYTEMPHLISHTKPLSDLAWLNSIIIRRSFGCKSTLEILKHFTRHWFDWFFINTAVRSSPVMSLLHD